MDYMLVNDSFLTISNGIDTVISDALEALIGAIYVESGINTTKNFIEKVIIKPFNEDDDLLEDKNFKSKLLEYTQANKFENPFYKVINEEGPNHAKKFTIEVFINKKSMGIGNGRNKKEAEQNAAKIGLEKLLEEGNDSLN